MLKVEKKVVYKAFGFSIISEIPLSELPQLGNKVDSNIDIVITREELKNQWSDLANKDKGFVIQKNLMLYKYEEIAIFLVQDGRKISVSPLKDYDEDIAKLVILGTCLGTILMQRKILPLHGSAIAINGKAYAIIGDSGAGKSTLASAFLNEGFHLLTDDLIALSISEENVPYINPAYPQQKLWEDSLCNFGMDKRNYNSIYGRETKFNVPVTSQYSSKAIPLGGILELVRTENGDIQLEEIQGLKGLDTIYRNTYRNFIIPKLGMMDWHFYQSTIILNKVNLYRLSRPTTKFNAPQLVSKILQTIGGNNDD
ncbi:aldolase [Bacillus sp. MUM 116]|uniref:aldolase n=1 Tax=Bacillus sp. MUM 116 TaxID=1678002 RepID=UPI0008F5A55C|nr:aldolase [Bacillus sp. MUM 116]OIK09386.1 aldolase [Bacillus sp. MUM 116]